MPRYVMCNATEYLLMLMFGDPRNVWVSEAESKSTSIGSQSRDHQNWGQLFFPPDTLLHTRRQETAHN